MLREMIVIISFMLVLVGIISGVVTVQKNATIQINKVERIIESSNEIN